MSDDALYKWKRPSVIPGFGVTFGFSMAYLGLIVLIPLAALVISSVLCTRPRLFTNAW